MKLVKYKCDVCKKPVEFRKDLFKVLKYDNSVYKIGGYIPKYVGDICLDCWKKITKEQMRQITYETKPHMLK